MVGVINPVGQPEVLQMLLPLTRLECNLHSRRPEGLPEECQLSVESWRGLAGRSFQHPQQCTGCDIDWIIVFDIIIVIEHE
jgi:hypothetical protein